MPNTITPFDTSKHHIHISFTLVTPSGESESLMGILDTGAPRTEFSDSFLIHMGFIKAREPTIQIKPGLQTQKYGKIILPSMTILGQNLSNHEVFVSRLDKSWGVAALIGLDFFKKFRVTIDYQKGQLVTEAYDSESQK